MTDFDPNQLSMFLMSHLSLQLAVLSFKNAKNKANTYYIIQSCAFFKIDFL